MKQSTLLKITGFCAVLFGVVAFAMMFLTAVTTGGDNPSTFTGTNLVFGKTLAVGSLFGLTAEAKINFSFLMLLAYFLPLIVACLLVVALILPKKEKGVKVLFGAVAFVGFVAALILVILTTNIASVTYKGSITGTTTGSLAEWNANYKLAIGSIIAIVANGLALCSAGTFTVLSLQKSGKKRK